MRAVFLLKNGRSVRKSELKVASGIILSRFFVY